MTYLTHTKTFKGLADVFFHNPKRYLPLVQQLEDIMADSSDLPHYKRESLALYSSQLNGCHYCVDSHSAVLRSMGKDMDYIDALREERPEYFSEKFGSLLLFVKKLTLEPKGVNAEDIKQVQESGWSDQAIDDAVNVVSLFSMINRIVDAFGLPGSDEEFKQFGGMVSKDGYAPLVQMIQQKIG